MIPLRDNNPTNRIPHVTYLLVAANVLVYVYEVLIGSMQQSQQFSMFVYTYGAIPSEIVRVLPHPSQWLSGQFGFPGPIGSLFTSMFLHGGFFHLAGNMVFLYIFGDNVEDELGPVRFLIFYLLCGLTAASAHVGIDFVRAQIGSGGVSMIPMVGASGAIGGIMGAYILLYPRARVLTLVIFFFITVVEIPAFWFLGIWFGLQFLGVLNNIGAGANVGGTAFWAHIGGFLMGLYLIRLWIRYGRPRHRKQWWVT